MIKLMTHQDTMADAWAKSPNYICFNTSDPGTGKTLGAIGGFDRSKTPGVKRMLVLAPLSILEVSWLDDIKKYGEFTAGIAHGTPSKREAVMRDTSLDIVITNHDAVKWIAKQPELIDHFTHLVIDESTAFKNAQTQRWKALMKSVPNFTFVQLMTGTPNPNTVMDLWAQAFLLDSGERLGNSFFRMRAVCCEPERVGMDPNAIKWHDRDGALDYAMDKLKDITVRFSLEECTDLPEHSIREVWLDMPPYLVKAYHEFQEKMLMEVDGRQVSAVHAGILVKKLLQMLSGAVYDSEGNAVKIHTERYETIMQFVAERRASLVGYNWGHELEAMISIADKQKIPYGVINGDASPKKRAEVVNAFQAGELQVVFAHPAAAAHGLTLTRGTATLWASPTYSSEQYQQFNRRIYRNGQTQKTETIRFGYRGSKEVDVYQKLDGKLTRMSDLLDMFTQNTHAMEKPL